MKIKLYIIHFEHHFYHAKHYIGITSQSLQIRLKKHRESNGACLTKAVINAGIKLESIHLIKEYFNSDEARQAEIKIKKRKESARFCPKCINQYKLKRNIRQNKKRKEKNEPTNINTGDSLNTG